MTSEQIEQERPTAAGLRAAKEEREAADAAKLAEQQAELEAAREQYEAAERQAAENTASSTRGEPRVDDQVGMFDKVIEDPELEAALEDREKVKASRSALNAKFKTADETAKGLIEKLDLEIGQVARIGRFKFWRTEVDGRQVSFETGASERLKIAPLDK